MVNPACRMTGCINSTDDFMTRRKMGIQGKKVVWFLLFLTVTITPFGNTAISQASNAEKSIPAETTSGGVSPSLADLIALAAGLDNRLSTLERDLAEGFDSTVTEQRFLQLNEKLEALSDRLQNLKLSKRYG